MPRDNRREFSLFHQRISKLIATKTSHVALQLGVDLMWSKTTSLETRSEQAIAPKHRSRIAIQLQVSLPPSYLLKDLRIRVIMARLVFSLPQGLQTGALHDFAVVLPNLTIRYPILRTKPGPIKAAIFSALICVSLPVYTKESTTTNIDRHLDSVCCCLKWRITVLQL